LSAARLSVWFRRVTNLTDTGVVTPLFSSPMAGRAQAAIIERGFARVRWVPEESQCFQSLLAAEGFAREGRRGIWANPEYLPRNANDPSLLERNGLYELVEGRIVSVGHGTRMIFLDFGRSYRRDFTVMVSPAVAQRLVAAGLPPDGFANRWVRVRGVIEESGGPAIRLNDPAEIEFLDDDQDNVGAHR
jgi:micrococcal nuclease